MAALAVKLWAASSASAPPRECPAKNAISQKVIETDVGQGIDGWLAVISLS